VTFLVPEEEGPQVGILVGQRVLPVIDLLETVGGDSTKGWSMIEFFKLSRATQQALQGAAEEAAAERRGYELASVRLMAPVPRPSKIIGMGYNYKALCKNEGVTPGPEPELFTKLPLSVVGPYDPVQVPKVIDKVDFEAELGVVIGRFCRDVSVKDALDYVAGYTCINDVTAKIIPRPPEAGSIILALKGCDTFAPTGPCLVTTDEIKDPQKLNLLCRVNGKEMQNFNTSDMVRTVAELISYISQRITLEPGDLLSTGTSLGIGIIKKPPVFLEDHDVVEVEIEKIGTISNAFAIPGLR
jgi:2-keto-4-pentenoate hydratase/2-oxohepta-3-ene-1,7-dioic acid hydratase in catechol pathway